MRWSAVFRLATLLVLLLMLGGLFVAHGATVGSLSHQPYAATADLLHPPAAVLHQSIGGQAFAVASTKSLRQSGSMQTATHASIVPGDAPEILGGVTRLDRSDRRYLVGISLIGGIWVAIRAVRQWTVVSDPPSLVPRTWAGSPDDGDRDA